jgi:putative endonuclease
MARRKSAKAPRPPTRPRPPQRHFAYFLRCADNSLYAGYTRDLKAREARHNQGHGGRYTASRLPVRIVYSESFKTQQLAMAREYAFKQLSKPEKEA